MRITDCGPDQFLRAITDEYLNTLVAKRKTLFDDRPVEIAELTYVIKQDLSSLNSQISSLQSLSKSQRPQPSRSSGADQEGEHNKNVRIPRILQILAPKVTLGCCAVTRKARRCIGQF